MLRRKLNEVIPSQHSVFNKLTGGDPYYFAKWESDKYGNLCLYYWFWNKSKTKPNKKRVPVSEIEAAVRVLLQNGIFSREGFRENCPISESAGSCGFVVIGRIFEYLGVASYVGLGKGFSLTNREFAERILGNL